ncbi:MAG TPA: isoaspartyl peptidase/L-asparaginase [Flavobacteriaceae bacterium]|nr:isoaspartyl peptidase/L-asparaginase [Flavobacteriaceae bacterium]
MLKIRFYLALFLLPILLFSCNETTNNTEATKENITQDNPTEKPYAIVIHGGAGAMKPEMMTDSLEKAYKQTLEQAVKAGHKILESGGDAIDAVTTSINILENSPLFNAGKGAVLTHDGTAELDASIMVGKDRDAGAVAGVTRVKNPILLAKAVMENSPHVMLSGKGAEEFAMDNGIKLVDPSYFLTERRKEALEKVLQNEVTPNNSSASVDLDTSDYKFGTVGCVALDKHGNIVAGTSTGGMTNKRWGRIGDSPIIGAGTYADNETCGISATGWGEFFIRGVVAHDIAARMRYGNESLADAAKQVIQTDIPEMGGDGGIVAIDKNGEIIMEFNTLGMYRASINKHGETHVAIYKD